MKLILKIVHAIISMLLVIKIKDFNFDNMLLGEKSYGNILICNISC